MKTNKITLKGKHSIGNIEFNHIEGGFGPNERCVLAYDIAEIHNKEVKHINEAINNNITNFKKYEDFIDLKELKDEVGLLDHKDIEEMGISPRSFARSKKIFLLSQRGYLKLVKILEDAKAWEVYNTLLDKYFTLKSKEGNLIEKINSDFLFKIALAMEEQEKLIAEMKPKVHAWEKIVAKGKCIDIQTAAQAFDIKGLGRNNMFQLLRDKKILQSNNKPYQRYINCGRFKSKVISHDYANSITLITPKGLEWLADKLTQWGYLEPSKAHIAIENKKPEARQLELIV